MALGAGSWLLAHLTMAPLLDLERGLQPSRLWLSSSFKLRETRCLLNGVCPGSLLYLTAVSPAR